MSEIKEKKQVFTEVTIGYVCDVCGVEVKGFRPNDWLWFNHHHGDWGNDSSESFEYFDVCSVECFTAQLNESINEMSRSKTAHIADMPIEFAKKLLIKLKS